MSNSNWIGQTIGERYQIEEFLGQGSISSVYKATDLNLKRVVAIKLFQTQLSSDENFVQRFAEQSAALAQLRNPNIVQVHAFDHDKGVYYMVMEFVPGETLQARFKRLNQAGRKMALDEVIKYMVEICDALEYAHQLGLIHQDLKPANIMLNVHSEAILMDFGIVKIVGGRHYNATGAVLGTARYLSPEQIKDQEIDRRSDIYSLGVILYEMVSGQPPFEADSAMTLMMMHVNDPVPDLSKPNPDIPNNLIGVIEKALSKEREARYQTAAEMKAAIIGAPTKPAASPDAKTVMDTVIPTVSAAGATVVASANPDVQPVLNEAANQETIIEEAPLGDQPSPLGADIQQVPNTQNKITVPKWIAGCVIALVAFICVLIGGVVAIPRLIESRDNRDSTAVSVAQPLDVETLSQAATFVVETAAVLAAAAEELPSSTPQTTAIPTNTPEPTPTGTPTSIPSITPSATFPSDLFIRINDIAIDNGYYVVEYETFGFQEQLPGTHIHFFFDTVTLENAGSPGNGPWILYGGPSPFNKYLVSERPGNASQLCARVVNPDHSLYDLESGNCYDLPE